MEVSSGNLVPLRGRSSQIPTFEEVIWESAQPAAVRYDAANHQDPLDDDLHGWGLSDSDSDDD